MVKCRKSALKALTKGGCLWATRIDMLTDKRNFLARFGGLHFVILECSVNGKVQDSLPQRH